MRLPRNVFGTLVPSPRPAFPTQGIPESINLAGVAENPFSRTEDPMACTRHVVLIARFSATGRTVCAQLLRGMAFNTSDVPPGAAGLSVMRPAMCAAGLPHKQSIVAKSVPLLQPRLPGRRQLVRLCSAGVVGPTRTSETGEEAEGTTDAIIARRVAFMFSFTGTGLSAVQAGRIRKKFGCCSGGKASRMDLDSCWFYYAAARDAAVRAAVGDE